MSTYSPVGLSGLGVDGLREIIREVVTEEIKKMLRALDRLASLSLAEVARK